MHEIHLDVVDSTNAYAKKHYRSFPKDEITCIAAEEQTAGRGRYQRKWTSPRGMGLYVTFYLSLPLNTLHLTALTQVLALSFALCLIKMGLKPLLKWPNDILLKNKKVSGVLCETEFEKECVHLFLGIGINVNLSEVGQIDQPATSLFLETGKMWDKEKVLQELQQQFEKDLKTFQKGGFFPFHKRFEELLAMKGETVRCFDGKKVWTGICHSITEAGYLNLLMPDQTIHPVLSGDIINPSPK